MNGRILLEADDESSAVGESDRFHCQQRHHSVEHAVADTRECESEVLMRVCRKDGRVCSTRQRLRERLIAG